MIYCACLGVDAMSSAVTTLRAHRAKVCDYMFAKINPLPPGRLDTAVKRGCLDLFSSQMQARHGTELTKHWFVPYTPRQSLSHIEISKFNRGHLPVMLPYSALHPVM